jgi:hypothetical protein
MQAMGEHMHIGFAPRLHDAIDPDEAVTVVEGGVDHNAPNIGVAAIFSGASAGAVQQTNDESLSCGMFLRWPLVLP